MSGQRLPLLSGFKVCKVLSKVGFYSDSIKGDHAKLKKDLNPKGRITVIVPLYDELSRSLLNQIIKQAGLTKEEFLELL